MVDLERLTGLTTQKGGNRYELITFYILSNSLNSYTALFSLHHHKPINMIVGGSLAGTTPVSKIFVLQDISQEEGGPF